jgi:thioredoxin reductase
MLSGMPPSPPRADWDAVVIGGGPAGLAAATWLGRYRRRTLVLDHGQHRNRHVEQAHGYLTRDPASPAEILEAARAGVERYEGVELRECEVVAVRGECGSFTVDMEDGTSVEAHRVVLASGLRDVKPEIGGFDEHYGASVFHCPACDGLEAKDQDVVVLGWSEDVAGFALELLDWAATLAVVTNGRRFEGDEVRREALARNGIHLVEEDASSFVGTRAICGRCGWRAGWSCPAASPSSPSTTGPGRCSPMPSVRARRGTAPSSWTTRGKTSVPGVYAAGRHHARAAAAPGGDGQGHDRRCGLRPLVAHGAPARGGAAAGTGGGGGAGSGAGGRDLRRRAGRGGLRRSHVPRGGAPAAGRSRRRAPCRRRHAGAVTDLAGETALQRHRRRGRRALERLQLTTRRGSTSAGAG